MENEKPFVGKHDKSSENMSLALWLYRVLQGAIIGVGAILPGISGGVLCVIFGIYQPMMALLAHPFRTFKTHARLLLPVLIGWVIGFIGLARFVEWIFSASYNIATWLFIGLIAGMTPSLFKEAVKEGRPRSARIALWASAIAILAILLWIQNGTKIQIQPNIWWFLVCGLLWGLSLVVPGLSSSSILIYLGLYQPMTSGIANLSPEVLIPMGIGVLLFVFLSARAVDSLFKKHYAVAFHLILGFSIASTIVIIPVNYKDLYEILWCIACFAVGFAIAWLMDKLGNKIQKQ